MIVFSVVNLFVFAFWIAWGVHTLSRVAADPLFQSIRGRQWLALAVIFTGPLAELVCIFIYSKRSAVSESLQSEKDKIRKMAEELQIFNSCGEDVFNGKASENSKNFSYVRLLLCDAVMRRSSDIFINPTGHGSYSIRFRQDGTLHVIDDIPERDAAGCISVLKVISSMDISEHRRPQDGAFSLMMKGAKISFRVATVGSYGGEKMAIRVLGALNGIRTLKDIGMSRQNYELLQGAVRYPSGLVMVCGPTGSGKTSTFYALIQEIDFGTKNVISIEDPIESEIPKVSQMEVNNQAGITFAALLRNALRQNPDVICVGEIRDEETAAIAVQAAQTGHLIIATIHSNDNLGTLDRLKMLGLPLKTVSEALQFVISQRLVRQLCPHCRKKIALPEKYQRYFEQNGLPTDNVYQAVGCPECGMTGYLGRHAVFDVLKLNNNLKKALEDESVNMADIRGIIERDHGVSLLVQDGYRLVAAGITTLEEVSRVAL